MRWRRDSGSPLDLGQFLVAEGFVSPEVFAKLERARQQWLLKQSAEAAPAPAEPAAPLEPIQPVRPAPAPRPVAGAPRPEPVFAPSPLVFAQPEGGQPPGCCAKETETQEIQLSGVQAAAGFQIEPLPTPYDPAPAPASQAAAFAIPVPAAPTAPAPPRPAPPRPAAAAYSAAPAGGYRIQCDLRPLARRPAGPGGPVRRQRPARAPAWRRCACEWNGTMEDCSARGARPRGRRARCSRRPRRGQRAPSRSAASSTSPTPCPASAASAPTSTASSAASTACSASSRRAADARASSACRPRSPSFTNYHQGMVLITGPAGCGKSSTLAALVHLDQRGAARPHPHDRGSDRVRAPLEALRGQPAPGRAPHRARSRARCAPRCARTRT